MDDLFQAWGDGPALERPIVLKIGLSLAPFPKSIKFEPNSLYIGMQTEQMFDENGKQLWGRIRRGQLANGVAGYDCVWDMSPSNKPAYNELSRSRSRKVVYGANIFPQNPVEISEIGEKLLFVGNLRERRRGIIEPMLDRVEIAKRRTFGAELFELSKQSKGLLNVHIEDGLYVEYPRLLKAFLAGKAYFSEPLSPPFIQGEHYFGLGDAPSHAQITQCYGRMSQLLSRDFAMRPFLTTLAKTCAAGGALVRNAAAEEDLGKEEGLAERGD